MHGTWSLRPASAEKGYIPLPLGPQGNCRERQQRISIRSEATRYHSSSAVPRRRVQTRGRGRTQSKKVTLSDQGSLQRIHKHVVVKSPWFVDGEASPMSVAVTHWKLQ